MNKLTESMRDMLNLLEGSLDPRPRRGFDSDTPGLGLGDDPFAGHGPIGSELKRATERKKREEEEWWFGDAYDLLQSNQYNRAFNIYRKKFPRFRQSKLEYENEFYKKWNEAKMENLDETHTAQWRRDIDALYNILGESDINQDHRIKPGTKKIGDRVGFKTDVEEYGEIVKIQQTEHGELFTLYKPDEGFEDDYIGGENYTSHGTTLWNSTTI